MSDYTEGSRRRDRHRRHRGGGNGNGNGQSREPASRDSRPAPQGTRDSSRSSQGKGDGRRNRTEERREELPPLPKLPTPQCARCGQPIQDITSALADRESGEPVHFDCVLGFLQGAENLAANEKLSYIGHGRFAVMVFDTPADARKFRIVRTIEWENRDTKAEWRADISERFSQVK
jgi:hypothetical protein